MSQFPKTAMIAATVSVMVRQAFAVPPTPRTEEFLTTHQATRAMTEGDRLVALYGATYATSNPAESPEDFATRYIQTEGAAFGVDDVDLRLVDSTIIRNGQVQVFHYRQYAEGLPIWASVAKVPVILGDGGAAHRIGFTAMHLSQHLTPLPQDIIDATAAVQSIVALDEYSHFGTFTAGEKLIYEDAQGNLRRVWHFIGYTDEAALAFFVDTSSGVLVAALPTHFDTDTISGAVTGAFLECCPMNDPEWPDCCSSLSAPTSGQIAGVRLQVLGDAFPACPSIDGTVIAEGHSSEIGEFSFAVPSPQVRLIAHTSGSWATTFNCTLLPQACDLLGIDDPISACAHPDLSGIATISFTPEPVDPERTAHVTAFRVVSQSHDWFSELVPDFLAIDKSIRVQVNMPFDNAYYDWGVEVLRIGGETAVANTAATPLIISHEYGHFVFDQILNSTQADLDFRAFHEAVADCFATLMWDSPVVGLGFHKCDPQRPLRRVDTPDVQLSNCSSIPPECGRRNCTSTSHCVNTSYHCVGLALSGAFWDLREVIGLAATQRLFADFLFVTDGRLDSSVIAEVLAADDTDGNLCNASPHSDAIVAAFSGHGWMWDNDVSCNSSGGIQIKWVGPTVAPSLEDGDYAINTRMDPPHVTLRATRKSGIPVTQWTVGRRIDGQAADVGRISAEWQPPHDQNIEVQVGDGQDQEFAIRNVHIVNIPAQDATKWSNVVFEMNAGSLTGHARCFPSGGLGGRLSGIIGGRAERLFAYGVGVGADSDSGAVLDIGGSTSEVQLEALAGGATLELGGGFSGEVRIAGDLDGLVRTSGPNTAYEERKIIVDGNLAGRVELTGAMAAAELLVGGGIIGEVSTSGIAPRKVLANADGVSGGSITGQVSIAGVFSGDICGDNLSADRPLPPNIQIGTWGASATICGVANACEYATDAVATSSNPVEAVAKNRYITIVPPNVGRPTAIRVRLKSLPSAAPTNFAAHVGEVRWVRVPPGVRTPADFRPDRFHRGWLECEPYYIDWSEIGTLYVTGAEIVPNATYEVQAFDMDCDSYQGFETNYSSAIQLTTRTVWGDITGDGNANLMDISAVVDAWRGAGDLPAAAKADIAPAIPNNIVDFVDIAAFVNAFVGYPYPYGGPEECLWEYDTP